MIVRVPRDGAVVARIRAELEANDYRVREIGPDSTSARASLPLLAASTSARAALRMHPTRAAVELWVASEGGAAGGSEIVRLPSEERDDALLAVRATEAMRARGLRLTRRSEPVAPAVVPAPGESRTPSTTSEETARAAAERAQAEAQAQREAEQKAEEKRQAEAQAQAQREADAQREAEQKRQADAQREAETKRQAEAEQRTQEERDAEEEAEEEAEAQRQAELEAEESEDEEYVRSDDAPSLLFVEVGPAFAASIGGASPTWAGWLNVRLQPSASWSVAALGYFPFAGGEISGREGSANIRTFLFGASFDVHAMISGIDISAGAGAAALVSRIRAEAAAPEFARQNVDDQYTGAVLARTGIQFSVAPRIRLSARVVFGLALPELQIKFGDDVAASWGRPFVLGVIGADFGLPAPLRGR